MKLRELIPLEVHTHHELWSSLPSLMKTDIAVAIAEYYYIYTENIQKLLYTLEDTIIYKKKI